jgi:hypothetical protein
MYNGKIILISVDIALLKRTDEFCPGMIELQKSLQATDDDIGANFVDWPFLTEFSLAEMHSYGGTQRLRRELYRSPSDRLKPGTQPKFSISRILLLFCFCIKLVIRCFVSFNLSQPTVINLKFLENPPIAASRYRCTKPILGSF